MKILLVEDDAGLVELITVKLEELGFSLMSAISGAEALAHLKNQTPDMMLLDYSLPDMNGKELIETLNKQQISLPPFIITTGQGDERIAVDMMKLGAMDYLVKDIIFLERLPKVVKRVIKEIESDAKLKQAEENLIKSELKFRALYNNAPLSYQSLNEDGSFLDVNPCWLSTLGYERDEIIGTSYEDLLHPDYKSHFGENFPKFKMRGYVHGINFKIRHKDGHYLDISFEGCIGYKADGSFDQTYCVFQDITERKKAEVELRRQRDLFELVINSIPIRIFWKDLNSVYLGCNKPFAKDAGMEIPENVIGKDDSVMVWKEYADKYRADDKQIMSTGISKLNYIEEFVNVEGEKVFWQTNKMPLKSSEGEIIGIISASDNITEKLKAEIELKESEERFRNAITYAPFPIMIHADSKILLLSEEWTKQTGYTIDDIPTIQEWTLNAYDDVVLNQKFIDKLYNIDKPQHDGEWSINLKDGRRRIWDFSSSPIGKLPNGKKMMISMASDVTERKQAEEKIRVAEENLHNTFDISPSIISKANLNTGYFIEVNQAVTRILGYSVEEFTSKPFEEFIYSDDNQRTKDEVATQLKGNKTTFFENRYLCKDGSYKWMAWNATEPNENGIVTGIASDITERKQAEKELKKALEKALESDRLKSAFLANMSHELRTPMNGILGFIELLNEPDLSKAEISEYSSVINKSSDRLLNTISDIINISKIEAGEIVVSNTDTSIDKMLEELYSFHSLEAHQKGLSLFLNHSLSDEHVNIMTDSHILHGILTNLIKNAIKFTYKGSIEFGYILRDDSELDRSAKVEFYVKDTGVGIPEDRMQAIFNRFEKADIEDTRVFEGSGLGLAISKAYVEMLGGEIFVESVVEKGSKFSFTIPYIQAVKKKIKKQFTDTHNENFKLQKMTLLIVEDDDISSELLETILKDTFKKLFFAENGVEAIQQCKNNPEIDLVLMDISMPVMSGYEATQQIRKFNKDIIIIAQTAYSMIGDKEKSIEAGCNDYISKPINKKLLLEMICKYAGKVNI